jgi:hypothetical protein
MKNILNRQLFFIPVLYILSKLLWGLIPINKLPEMLKVVLSDLTGPLLFMLAIFTIFIYFLWKVPLIGKLAQILFGTKPNIQGTWRGRLNYEWDGKKMEKFVFLVIKQTDGYSLNIRLLTDERISSNIFADVISTGGVQRIIYTYSNEESPDNRDKNPSHEGFCQLDIVETSNILQGIYYTTRGTFGKLSFDKKCRKVVINFEKAQRLFKMS